MIHKTIEKLIPYINENFITYPLWEEGKYIPFVNFWQICKSEKEEIKLHKKLQTVFENSGYIVEVHDYECNATIMQYSLFPNYDDLEDGSFEFIKKDWSIEEMIELLVLALNSI